MQLTLTREFITEALSQSILDPRLRAIYDLCFMVRHHHRDEIVADKLRMIVRLYSDSPYWPGKPLSAEAAAHRLVRSPVDTWFSAIYTAEELDIGLLMELHGRVMSVFADLPGDEARSLASKYLHFHFPELFHVYDSRISTAVSLLTAEIGDRPRFQDSRNWGLSPAADPVYSRFHACCRKLTDKLAPQVGRALSPRELDRVLRTWLDQADFGDSHASRLTPHLSPLTPHPSPLLV